VKAPFPWYGGKSRAAHLIWPRFGDPVNYVEAFAGSLAVLLLRPHQPRTETVNDKDCYLSNFWRALQADPEAVCHYCDWPVNEADLHARHAWLLSQADFRERMMADTDFYDAKVAGWWVWGLCQWIGGQWCDVGLWERTQAVWLTTPNGHHQGVHKSRPIIEAGGRGVLQTWRRQPDIHCDRGVHRKRPSLAKGFGVQSKRPELRQGGRGISRGNQELLDYLQALAARLRRVRVCCGDFERVLGPAATTTIGLTAVLLDPPYGIAANRDSSIYAAEDLEVAPRARAWALAHGDDSKLRIALCGYDGEHAMPASWQCVAWRAHGGTSKNDNHTRERIWFSPHCLNPATLFNQDEEAGGTPALREGNQPRTEPGPERMEERGEQPSPGQQEGEHAGVA
jgi:hypothetical protein